MKKAIRIDNNSAFKHILSIANISALTNLGIAATVSYIATTDIMLTFYYLN
jgi:hypothetical protein